MAAAGSMKKWQIEKLRNQNNSLWATASLEANFLLWISRSFHVVCPDLAFSYALLASQGQSFMVRLARSLSSHFCWHTCPTYFSRLYNFLDISLCHGIDQLNKPPGRTYATFLTSSLEVRVASVLAAYRGENVLLRSEKTQASHMLKGMKERSALPSWRPGWWCGILRSLSAWLLDEFMHVCWSIISVIKECLPKLTTAIPITPPEKVLRASHREYKKKSSPPEIFGLQAMESCTKQQQ